MRNTNRHKRAPSIGPRCVSARLRPSISLGRSPGLRNKPGLERAAGCRQVGGSKKVGPQGAPGEDGATRQTVPQRGVLGSASSVISTGQHSTRVLVHAV